MKNSNKVLLGVVIGFLSTIFITTAPTLSIASNVSSSSAVLTYNLQNFNSVVLNGGNNITIKNGANPSVVIENNSGFAQQIDVHVTAQQLEIDTPDHISATKIVITTNQPIKNIELNGGNHLTALEINTTDLSLKTNGASDCHIAGTVNNFKVETSGASHVDAQKLLAKNVDVDAAGASHIRVTASDTLRISAAGASDIQYFGNPKQVSRNVVGFVNVSSGD